MGRGFWNQYPCGYPGPMVYTVSFNDLCESTWSKNGIAPHLIRVGTKDMCVTTCLCTETLDSPQGEYARICVEKKERLGERKWLFPRHRGKAGLTR